MSESLPDKIDTVSRLQFDGTAADTDIRTLLYWERAHPQINWYEKAQQALQLRGDERVLEVGCGSGRFVQQVVTSRHQGEVFGIDIDELYISTKIELEDAGYQNMHFQLADMRQLPFDDSSFDALASNYNLYHVSNPERALKEAQRVVVPGGRLVVLTRGSYNLIRHWDYATQVAKSLGFDLPVSPYFNFEAEEAPGILGRYFTIDWDNSFPSSPSEQSRRTMKLNADDWFSYSHSMYRILLTDTMASETGPLPVDTGQKIRATIEALVKPEFDSEVEQSGFFRDMAHDRLIACVNDK